MKKVRESNFEILRCIFMFMVVLVHYNAESMGKAFLYVQPNTINYYLIYFMESMAIIGTNGFILLTGYFSWKKERMSLRKPFGLLLYVIAYNLLFYVLDVAILGMPFSLRSFVMNFIPNNWYITLYVVLVLLSPFINKLLNHLNRKSSLVLVGLMFAVFSVWPTMLDVANGILGVDVSGMQTITMTSSGFGYSIVNFVMLYVIGAVLSKFDLLKHHLKWDILAYLLFTCLIFLQQLKLCAAWSYANPFVILSCISFFNIFRKIHVKSNVINRFAQASLGVFLIHTKYMVSTYAWSLSGIQSACQGHVVGLLIHMFLCCAITYILCSIFDMACRWITNPVSNLLNKIVILNKEFISAEE